MRRFTIIELVVAMSLTIALLASLFASLHQVTRLKREVADHLAPIRATYALLQRLEQVIPEMSGPSCYLDDDRLVFIYNNGIDKEPQYCGDLLATLHVDEDKLLLTTWPLPSRWEESLSRTEIIADNISKFAWRFYQPPNLEDPLSEVQCEIPTGWNKSWPEENKSLPALIELTCNDDTFTLAIPEANKPIRCWK